MAKADLHSHSTVSDGRLSPAALLARAAEKGVGILALTDHDNVAGLAEARAAALKLGLRFVDGVEISADYGPGTMHILGLGIDPANSDLLLNLDRLQQARRDRNPSVIRRLNELGVPVTLDEVAALAKGGQVGRPHFAEALLARGVVKSFEEAFSRFLAKGAPAYVPKARLSPEKSIQAIHAAGGLAVLAHPIQLGLEAAGLESKVAELKGLGLDAIEVWHSDHGQADTENYLRLASRHGLLASAGSDFHGIPGKKVELGIPHVDEADLAALLKAVLR